MKSIAVLVFQLAVIVGVSSSWGGALIWAAQPNIEEEKMYWQDLGLSREMAFRHFSDEVCLENERQLRGCIEAIRTLSQWSERPVVIELTVQTTKSEPDREPLVTVGPFGVYATRQVSKAGQGVPPAERRRQMFEMKQIHRAALDQFVNGVLASVAHSAGLYDFADLFLQMAQVTLPDPSFEAMAMGHALSEFRKWQMNDPHLRWTVDDFEENRLNTADESLVGIGVRVTDADGGILAHSIIKGGPADRAGLKRGDLIFELNGMNLNGLSSAEAVKLILGPEGSPVEIKVLRKGDMIVFEFQRERVVIANVEAEVMSDSFGKKVGYVKINHFMDRNLCETLRGEIERFQHVGVESLMIDLRDNGGGLLSEAVCMIGLFVGRKIAVKVRDTGESNLMPYLADEEKITDLPLTVLINAHSASASEVFAGAIQDHRRGLIFGYRSFGKGSVQAPQRTRLLGVIEYATVQRFYSPVGHPIQGRGVLPDVQAQTPEQEFVERYNDIFDEFEVKQEEDAVASETPAAGSVSESCQASMGPAAGELGLGIESTESSHEDDAILSEALGLSLCLIESLSRNQVVIE